MDIDEKESVIPALLGPSESNLTDLSDNGSDNNDTINITNTTSSLTTITNVVATTSKDNCYNDPSVTLGNEVINDAQKLLNVLIEMKNNNNINVYNGSKEGLLVLSTLKNTLQLSLQTVNEMYNQETATNSSMKSNTIGTAIKSTTVKEDSKSSHDIDHLDVLEEKLTDNTSVFSDATSVTGISGVTGMTGITGISHVTGVTGMSYATGVSSIGGSITMNDPLIVMMGIGKYNGLPNLDGVEKDYNNIINTFVNYWKFKVFYKLDNGSSNNVYTNKKEELKRNYKLEWSDDEIHLFLEEARQCVVENKHNGLIFAISSHGDKGRVLTDSTCESYELDSLYSCFSPQASILLESYKETEEQTNRLFQIPKIFLLDMCRGSFQAKVTKLSSSETNDTSEIETKTNKKHLGISLHNSNISNNSNKSDNGVTSTTQKYATMSNTPPPPPPITATTKAFTNKKENTTTSDNESFTIKGSKLLSKEDASAMVAQMANFCKIYANTDGCAVADGSINGGVFLRNVCNVFKDTKFVTKHKWNEIVIKIREYTKRDATLYCNLVNFTQLVENEGTLERPVVFGSKYLNFAPLLTNLTALGEMNDYDFSVGGLMSTLESADENAAYTEKLLITNCSFRNKIAVLVEMEQNRENRKQMIKLLTKTNGNDRESVFIENGYVIIDKNQADHKFHKVWDEYFVTLFKLPGDEKSNNELIFDRQICHGDYLYFRKRILHTMHDEMGGVRPKCNAVQDESHKLLPIKEKSKEMNVNLCVLCQSEIAMRKYRFYCEKCNHSFCQHCMHSLFMNQIPKNTKFNKTSLRLPISNFSQTNKIAVMIHAYSNAKHKSRGKIISNSRYKTLDDKEFIENGFVIIDKGGSHHIFSTLWKEFSLTLIKIEEKADNVLLYHKRDVPRSIDATGMYFANDTLQFVAVNVPACNAVAQESHELQPFVVDKELMGLMDIAEDGMSCILCTSDIDIDSVAYYCIKCNHSVCKRCCYYLYWNIMPPALKSPNNHDNNRINIRNMSKENKIAVFVGIHSGYNKSRQDIVDTSKYEFIKDKNVFINQGFAIIDCNGADHRFDTIWKSCQVTVVKLAISNSKDAKNELIYYGMLDFGDEDEAHFYYKQNQLIGIKETLPKCKAVRNEEHALEVVRLNQEEMENKECCVWCSSTITSLIGYGCKTCNHLLCQGCCDYIIWNQMPPNAKLLKKGYKLQIRNLSLTNKIAILLSVDNGYNQIRKDLIETQEYKQLRNEKYLIEKGFIMINTSVGDKDGNHWFSSVWSSCYITMIEMTVDNLENEIICDEMFYFPPNGIAQLCHKNGRLIRMAAKCKAVQNEAHSFDANWISEQEYEEAKTNGIDNLDCCYLCLSKFEMNHFNYNCKQCKHSICSKCFESLCFNMKPQNIKSCNKITIRNMSEKSKIAVLITVDDGYNESRQQVIETSEYLSEKNEEYYEKRGFITVDANGGSHLFNAVWKSCYITAIKLSTDKSDNEVIYDAMFHPDIGDDNVQLYYRHNVLGSLAAIGPQCMAVSNESHSLIAVWHDNDEKESVVSSQLQCVLCKLEMKYQDYSYYCKQCDHSLCSECFDSLCWNKIPPNIKSLKKLSVKNMSQTNKIAVLVTPDEPNSDDGSSMHSGTRAAEYAQFTSEQEFVEKGFIFVTGNGASNLFNTVWGSCHVTAIKITTTINNIYTELIYDARVKFADDDIRLQLCYKNGILANANEMDVQCRAVPKESHALTAICINGSSNLTDCILCSSRIKENEFRYYCKECNHAICEGCFDSLCLNQIPPNLSPNVKCCKFNIKNMFVQSKIAVLVGYNVVLKNMIETYEYMHLGEAELVGKGFIIINESGSDHWFDALWRCSYLTILKIQRPISELHSNMLIYNGSVDFSEDVAQIYCSNDKLFNSHEMRAKCKAIHDENHSLYAFWNNDVNNDKHDEKEEEENKHQNLDTSINVNDKSNSCLVCLSKFISDHFSYYCKKCNHSLCDKCFDSICFNQIPLGLESLESGRKLNIRNLSDYYPIAVKVIVDKNENDRLGMYTMVDENEFIERGYIIINEKGGSHWFETIWAQCHVRLIEITPIFMYNKLIYDKTVNFQNNKQNKAQFYFRDGHFVPSNELLPNCTIGSLQGETHLLDAIWIDKDASRCNLCLLTIKVNNFSYHCKKCDYSLCQKCCDSLILDGTPADNQPHVDDDEDKNPGKRKFSTRMKMLLGSQK